MKLIQFSKRRDITGCLILNAATSIMLAVIFFMFVGHVQYAVNRDIQSFVVPGPGLTFEVMVRKSFDLFSFSWVFKAEPSQRFILKCYVKIFRRMFWVFWQNQTSTLSAFTLWFSFSDSQLA